MRRENKPVVPVPPGSLEVLGKGEARGGYDCTGRGEGEELAEKGGSVSKKGRRENETHLQAQSRPEHRLPPASPVGALGEPAEPERLRIVAQPADEGLVERRVLSGEGLSLAAPGVVLRGVVAIY